MAGEIKKLRRSEGVTVGAPTDLSIENEASSFAEYASDAAYVTAKGSAAADGDVYYNTVTDTVRVYAAGSWTDLGSGAGGGINYIVMSTGTVYDDAAADRPVDGTGGTPTVTFTANSTTPLVGAQDYKLSKDAADRQGEGVAFDFTIDKIFEDAPQVFTTKFYFSGSANFSADDITVYIIQDTGGTPIVVQPHSYTMDATQGLFQTTWQPQAGVADYRVCIHIASTNASAWDLQIDELETGPQEKAHGPAMTDWDNFTPTITGGTASLGGSWRRVGDTAEIQIRCSLSTITGTIALGFADVGIADATKSAGGASNNFQMAGHIWDNSESKGYGISPFLASTTTVSFYWENGGVVSNAAGPIITLAADDRINVDLRIPIVGWSSNTLVSSDADTRVVACKYVTDASGQSLSGGANNTVLFQTKRFDTHGAFASGLFTAPVSGYYQIATEIRIANQAGNDGHWLRLDIEVDGTVDQILDYMEIDETNADAVIRLMGSAVVKLDAGEQMELNIAESITGTPAVSAITGSSFVSIHKVSGPAQIAASEVVVETASTTTAGAYANNTAITLATNDVSTHGAWSSATFTAPMSGRYRVSAMITYTNMDTGASEYCIIGVVTSTSITKYLDNHTGIDNAAGGLSGSVIVPLDAGDTFQLKVFHSNSSNLTISTGAGYNHIDINRIGGVM